MAPVCGRCGRLNGVAAREWYIHRYQLVRRSRFVPRDDCPTPVPEWKRSDWAFDALPRDDPARDPDDRDILGR